MLTSGPRAAWRGSRVVFARAAHVKDQTQSSLKQPGEVNTRADILFAVLVGLAGAGRSIDNCKPLALTLHASGLWGVLKAWPDFTKMVGRSAPGRKYALTRGHVQDAYNAKLKAHKEQSARIGVPN
jgi:hypothetical protein